MAFLTNLPSLRWQVRHVLSLVILLRLCGLPVPHGDPLRVWSYDGKDLSDHHDVWCMSGVDEAAAAVRWCTWRDRQAARLAWEALLRHRRVLCHLWYTPNAQRSTLCILLGALHVVSTRMQQEFSEILVFRVQCFDYMWTWHKNYLASPPFSESFRACAEARPESPVKRMGSGASVF